MFAVGVTDNADVAKVSALSSYPETENLNFWLIEDFTNLMEYASVLAQGLCGYLSASGTQPVETSH